MSESYRPVVGALEDNWNALFELLDLHLSPSVASAYDAMLKELKDDVNVDGKLLLGALRAPAAKGNHHAHEGGWCFHILELWWVWDNYLRAMTREGQGPDSPIADEVILKGIINHDLHKTWRTYELLETDPWKTQYAEDLTDKLLGNNLRSPRGTHKNLFMLQQHGIKLTMEDYNVILNAEGGWSETQTYWCTVAAKMAYLLDECSGNILGRISTGRLLGHNQQV